MTDDAQSLAVGAAPGEAASEAALIATFYGRRHDAPIRALHEHLYRSSASTREAPVRDRWENPADGTIGRRFDPPGRAAHDATAIQLALNAPGGATRAWETMRLRLESIVDGEDLDGIWGYTLVYQAVLTPGVDADVAFKDASPVLRRLRSSEGLQPLAQADVPGGRAWLLAIPDLDTGLNAGSVYVALGPPEGEAALLDMFYGPAAALLAPDLIAHKGYYQMRQFRGGEMERRYEESVGRLHETTDELLKDLGRRDVESDRLERLFGMYNQLLPLVSALKELHIGLQMQLENLDWWRERTKSNDIIEFHRDQLRMVTLELALKEEPLRYALDTADKAVSAAQVQLNKAQEDLQRQVEQAQRTRQRRTQTTLTLVALALGVPAIIDRRAAGALLELVGSELPRGVLALLGVQVAVIVIVALLIWLGISVFNKRRGR